MNKDSVFQCLSPNSLALFNYIQKQAPIAKSDLCKLTGRRVTTVNRMLEPLERMNLIVEYGIGTSTGGRKPILYGPNPTGHYVGAINISMTYCKVSVMNFKLETLASERFEMSRDYEPEFVVDLIVEIFNSLLISRQISKAEVHGAGVSIFGSLNHETGGMHKPVILYLNEKWVSYPLAKNLKEKLGFPIAIEKGTNAAAMLEYFYGKAKNNTRFLYILCAMNIRSAVIVNGSLLSIAPRYEDAFGHMVINFDGEECPCGKYGCVDCYVTIPAIVSHAALEIKKGRPTVLDRAAGQVTFKDICQAAEQGDGLACDVITSAASVMGLALANYINLFSPDTVVLSGLIIKESPLYYKIAAETASNRYMFSEYGNAPVRFEQNGYFEDAITVGAGSVMIESLCLSGKE